MLTFMTVVCFLAPIYGPEAVLTGTSFHMHAAAPLFCFSSFCFMETESKLSFKSTFIGIIPMLMYSVFYTAGVVFLGTMQDYYSFNIGGYWYVSASVIIIVTYIIAVLTMLIHNRFSKS